MTTFLTGWDCRDDGHLYGKYSPDTCVMCHTDKGTPFADEPFFMCQMCAKVYPTQLEADLCTPDYLIPIKYPHRAKDYS